VQTNAVDMMSILHVCAESRDVPPLEAPYDNLGMYGKDSFRRYRLNRKNDNRGVGGTH